MRSNKVAAAMLAGLLYGQGLLGLIGVAVMLERNAGWGTPTGGYGVESRAPASVELAQADLRPDMMRE